MFIDMILRHIPRSPKAFIALAVLLVSTSLGFNALGTLLVHPSAMVWLQCVGGIIVALCATVVFYRCQSESGRAKTNQEIEVETLARAGEQLKQSEQLKRPTAGMTAYNLNDDAPPNATAGSRSNKDENS